ncbi:MAG: hypothetical protein QM796_16770 [Chthoniobacteraceae bacterium]
MSSPVKRATSDELVICADSLQVLENSIDPFVEQLLHSYENVGGLNNRDAHNLPSKRAVAEICEDLLQLLFPGFHDDDSIHHSSIREITTVRLTRVVESLAEQVRKSVRIGDPKRPTGRTAPILQRFCQSLPEVRELLRTDIQSGLQRRSLGPEPR